MFCDQISAVKLLPYVASLLCISTEMGSDILFSVLWLDSVFTVSEGYYSRVLLAVSFLVT